MYYSVMFVDSAVFINDIMAILMWCGRGIFVIPIALVCVFNLIIRGLIYKISYNDLMIMLKLRSTYGGV